jgi:hypothetical protein
MFRFTIRELVLLTLVVAMGVGWCVDRTRHFYSAEYKAAFWKNIALAFQSRLESDGYRIWVGHERTISITDPAGTIHFQSGATGREILGLDALAPWPTADELYAREL